MTNTSSPSPTLSLTQELIRRESPTPEDAGCQKLLSDRLTALGFHCEHLRFGEGEAAGPVDNLWAVRKGSDGDNGALFCFAGHTDVVPVGNLDDWDHPPYSAEIIKDENGEEILLGRGTADMKGSIAAMIVAIEEFLARNKQHTGRIAFLITSDEEGPSVFGTKKVIEHLEAKHEKITWCLVGEPSSSKRLGDVVKNGRRGSLTARLTLKGIQGHVAYPEKARNPIHLLLPALNELSQREWDTGNEFFPPSSFQIADMHSGTGASNVIPGDINVIFNIRFSTEWTAEQLQTEIITTFKKYNLDLNSSDCKITWEVSHPFLTAQGKLVDAVVGSLKDVANIEPQLLTNGGTSDGRFIAPTGAEVVELGPLNATIHKVNEYVSVNDLETLKNTYSQILEKLLR